MSILIKDTDIRAGDIIVVANIDGKLKATLPVSHGDRKWHDVVEIPTPHGDLIDRDVVSQNIDNNMSGSGSKWLANSALSDAPTIIEAED